MITWTVIVGNIGAVYQGESEAAARQDYHDFIAISQGATPSRATPSRANGEPVTLLKDGVIVLEYEPEDRRDEDTFFHPNDGE